MRRANTSAARRLQSSPGSLWSALPQFTARDGTLLFDGHPLSLKGASWFGAEGKGAAPDGLWAHAPDFYLDFLARNGFNALRLPFALDLVLSNPTPSHDMLQRAPGLWGVPYLELLDDLIDRAAARHVLVLLDLHRLRADEWPTDGLWYGGGRSLHALVAGWEAMASRFCGKWNVIGADLLNEPHGARWEEWAAAAGTLGDAVLARCPRWLIFVEGVAHEGRSDRAEYFWGENLEGARKLPVELATAEKLVYSPHVYGPGDGRAEHHMPYFDEKSFPHNMAAVWERHFGFLPSRGEALVVGEWGGTLTGKDKVWQEAFFAYVRERRLSFFYWSLNPNSEDTGGLLGADWTAREEAKLRLLAAAPSTALAPLLRARPSFACASPPARAHFACASGGLCVLREQKCNGLHECADESDETHCDGARPCLTTAGEDCALPFVYNGFEYATCTLVDAAAAWVSVGAGRCARGFVAAAAAAGGSLEACEAACERTRNCSLVSFTDEGGGYCSGYTQACAAAPLLGGGGYRTFARDAAGGAWCPTRVAAGRQFLSAQWAGVCGPACAAPPRGEADDASRALCGGRGGGDAPPAHCAPRPPFPPRPPLPPLPPLPPTPPASPPHTPPRAPPAAPLLLEQLLLAHPAEAALLLCAPLAAASLALAVGARAFCRRARPPPPRRRHIRPEEMMALAHERRGGAKYHTLPTAPRLLHHAS
ncbi:hypothetical protein AB1Y20_012418 [Prymnesium parvum]|uniref:Glycoside hydrolase family 5 domain-containing protein n=1 Tax=Prymnesium parvum TaxID=97485 RepID=A0AB34IKA2_PRYPA